MKVLWLDDHATDKKYRDVLLREWDLDEDDVVPATTLRQAQQLLETSSDIKLLILDLLWGNEPEHAATHATGIKYLEALRKEYPGLLIATRSQIKKPAVLTAYIHYFVTHRVVDHFLVDDMSPHAAFRRSLVLERAQQRQREIGLSAFLGERWGAVMFADISGFTTMTEKLWGANQTKLMETLHAFYAMATEVVTNRGGVIDKLIGDEVMAIFPARTSDDRRTAAISCIDAAVDVRNRFLTIERDFKRDLIDVSDGVGDTKWQLKIGVEAGSLRITREFLAHGEPEYCAIGFAVNVAARIKGLSGPYTITVGPTLQPLLPQADIYATDRFAEQSSLPGFGRKLWLYTLREPTPPKPA
jgi:class 3 adenylate cyclase